MKDKFGYEIRIGDELLFIYPDKNGDPIRFTSTVIDLANFENAEDSELVFVRRHDNGMTNVGYRQSFLASHAAKCDTAQCSHWVLTHD